MDMKTIAAGLLLSIIYVFIFLLGAWSNTAVLNPIVKAAERDGNSLRMHYYRNPFTQYAPFLGIRTLTLVFDSGWWEDACGNDENPAP